MTDADAIVLDLRRRVTAVQRERARAEAARDAAAVRAAEARQQLAAQFGVSGVDDARAGLAELTATFTARVATLRDLLDDIGEQP